MSSAHVGEGFTLDLTATGSNTLVKVLSKSNSHAQYQASAVTGVGTALDALGLRDVNNITLLSPKKLKYSWGKLLALKNLARYKDNHDLVKWKVPWVGYLHELGSLVDVRSWGESQTRRVRIFQVRRAPLDGTVQFQGEAE